MYKHANMLNWRREKFVYLRNACIVNLWQYAKQLVNKYPFIVVVQTHDKFLIELVRATAHITTITFKIYTNTNK